METVPEGVEESIATTGEIVTPEEISGESERSYAWIWIIVIILVLIVISYKIREK
jgi:hypothetical protein